MSLPFDKIYPQEMGLFEIIMLIIPLLYLWFKVDNVFTSR
jgi:hypothetical protein